MSVPNRWRMPTAPPERDVPLSAAGYEWRRRKAAERDAMVALYDAIRVAVAEGVSQSEAARVAGVDRMTVRRALGLRRESG